MYKNSFKIIAKIEEGLPVVKFTGIFTYGEMRRLFGIIEKEYHKYIKEKRYESGGTGTEG